MKRATLILLGLLWPVFASAQVETGTPPYGTFGGGPDVIDLANLNAHLAIPVLNKAGRGTNFTYNLNIESSVWYPLGSVGSQIWQPNGFGLHADSSAGYTTHSIVRDSCPNPEYPPTLPKTVPGEYFTNYVYRDIYGVSHQFSSILVENDDCQDTGPQQATADDGSGYTMTVGINGVAAVTAPTGSLFNPPDPSGSGAASMTDRNGNEITENSSGDFYDTLSSTTPVMTITGSSPLKFNYTAPSGSGVAVIVNYETETVRTNFGCSGIAEFGPTSENLISEIDLPDVGVVPNDKYTFTYEPTPGFSGDVTGRLASITLPTGGTITYSYSGGSNGITCADGSTTTLTRKTPDGTWTYAHTENGTAWATTVTDPQGNQTIYNFQGIYQTERKVYQGTTTLLEDDVTCYNGNTSNCNTTAITLPILARTVTDTLGSQVCKHLYSYNVYGLYTGQTDYDYGNGTPGPPLRTVAVSYASLGNNIASQPASVIVENGSGTIVMKTTVTYDQGTPVATSGTPQHVAITGSRGNPTSISYTVAGSATLTKSFTYFDTGNVDVATDVNNAQTTFTYGDCGNSFPTSVSEPLGLSKSMVWNCTGGVETSVTDENGKTVSATYNDSYFWRPATTTDQEGNQTTFYYAPNSTYPNSPYDAASWMTFNNGSSISSDIQYKDSLGRTYVDQHWQSPNSSILDSVSFAFDSNGRPYSTSGPCSVGYTGTCSGPITTQTYDALNRALVTTDGGNGTVTLSYPGNDILQVIGPAPSGENRKQRQSEYNPLGELTSVCEITGLSGSGTCGQTSSATGYWTKYAYDGAGRLLTVSQNAQSTSQVQTRSYTYDELGRMTSETNPETGTKSYVYDSDSTCGTSKGDLVKRADAAGNVSCYAYDAVHRITSITYSGPNSGNTPTKYFVYDSVTVNQVVMANAKTRLAEAYTCISPCSSKITDEGFSYTVRGEVQDVYESTPHSNGYFHVDETYWANGVLNQVSGLAGLPTLTYGVDGEGRPYSTSAGSGQNPVSSTSYNVASEATGLNLGSSDSDAFQFDPNTFRMTQYKFTVNSQSVVGNLTWNANGSLGTLAIADPFNAANTQTCTYSHDDLSRIASGNCGSIWSQTFSYDAFGNITKSGTNSFNPGYNSNNQMLTGASYDANGDVLSDSLHTYAWDVETRPTTIDTVTVTYDALGRMVEQNKSGTYTEIVYDALGNKLALMNGTSTLKQAFVPLPAGATAVYNASGLQYYRHPDWLGSSRFSSTPSRTMYNDLAFAPFGEIYATSGTTTPTNISFAGNNEDTTTNLYDAYFREYGVQGRWPSPDPAGVAAANPGNPQSWNRYAYALNNPLLFIDPSGLVTYFWVGSCLYAEYTLVVTVQGGDSATSYRDELVGCVGSTSPVGVQGGIGGNSSGPGGPGPNPPSFKKILACAAGAPLIAFSLINGDGASTTSFGGSFGVTEGPGPLSRDRNYTLALNGDSQGNVSLTSTIGQNKGNLVFGFGYSLGVMGGASGGTVNALNDPSRSDTVGLGPVAVTGSSSSASFTAGDGAGFRYSGAYDQNNTQTIGQVNCLSVAISVISSLIF